LTAAPGATPTDKRYDWTPGQENSAGAVVYRKESGGVLYLLLHYEEGHWGSAKGHRENNETPEDTARREIYEETGLNQVCFDEGFQERISYSFQGSGGPVCKSVIFFLAETTVRAVRLSAEHVDYGWLPYAAALEKITYADEKKVLQKAGAYLRDC
jgi:bis(5'-nucleosidyl)-tetraphosphatase